MAVDRVAHRTPMNATRRAIAQKAVSLSAAPAAETNFSSIHITRKDHSGDTDRVGIPHR